MHVKVSSIVKSAQPNCCCLQEKFDWGLTLVAAAVVLAILSSCPGSVGVQGVGDLVVVVVQSSRDGVAYSTTATDLTRSM